MKEKLQNIRTIAAAGTLLALAQPALAQDWVVLDTFEGGVPQANWEATPTVNYDTSAGYLKIGQIDGSNTTASMRVPLPVVLTSGKLTIAFDFYLPVPLVEGLTHEVGFGAGSQVQTAQSGWGAVGLRNRFQMIGPYPQALGNAWDWGVQGEPDYGTAQPDCLGETEYGVVYNVWLVYEKDPRGTDGVTIYSKKSTEPMPADPMELESFYFPYDPDGGEGEDWSSIQYFVIGQGLISSPPASYIPSDVLGGIFDNFHVSQGENLTMTPTGIDGTWTKIETFAGGSPEGDWTLEDGVSVDVDGAATITASEPNSGAVLDLPIPLSTSGSMTLTMDIQIPTTESDNSVTWGATNDGLLAGSTSARFGESYFYVDYFAPDFLLTTNVLDGVTDLFNPSELDQWYHLWLVYDQDDQRVDWYSVPFAESGEPTLPTEPFASYDWTNELDVLDRFLIGSEFGGGTIRIDNIYQSFGTNISLSPTAGDVGGGGPELGLDLDPGLWNVTDIGWIWGFADSADWGYSTFMGFIQVASYPWLNQASFGWVGVIDEPDFYYSYALGTWLYAPANWLGRVLYWDGSEWVENDLIDPVL